MVEWLINLPAFVKTGLAFTGILLVYRFGAPLGISILIHSLALTLISGAGIKGLLLLVKNFKTPESWLLIIVISQPAAQRPACSCGTSAHAGWRHIFRPFY